MSNEKFNPRANPRLKLIEHMGRTLILIGMPEENGVTVSPEEGRTLGIDLMETCLHVLALERAENQRPDPASEASGDQVDAGGNGESGNDKKNEGGE